MDGGANNRFETSGWSLAFGHSSRVLIVQRRLNQLRSSVQNETGKLKWTDKDSVILLRRYGVRFFFPLLSQLTHQRTVDLHP